MIFADPLQKSPEGSQRQRVEQDLPQKLPLALPFGLLCRPVVISAVMVAAFRRILWSSSIGHLRIRFGGLNRLTSFQPKAFPALRTSIRKLSQQESGDIVETIAMRPVHARARAIFAELGHTS